MSKPWRSPQQNLVLFILLRALFDARQFQISGNSRTKSRMTGHNPVRKSKKTVKKRERMWRKTIVPYALQRQEAMFAYAPRPYVSLPQANQLREKAPCGKQLVEKESCGNFLIEEHKEYPLQIWKSASHARPKLTQISVFNERSSAGILEVIVTGQAITTIQVHPGNTGTVTERSVRSVEIVSISSASGYVEGKYCIASTFQWPCCEIRKPCRKKKP